MQNNFINSIVTNFRWTRPSQLRYNIIYPFWSKPHQEVIASSGMAAKLAGWAGHPPCLHRIYLSGIVCWTNYARCLYGWWIRIDIMTLPPKPSSMIIHAVPATYDPSKTVRINSLVCRYPKTGETKRFLCGTSSSDRPSGVRHHRFVHGAQKKTTMAVRSYIFRL